MPFRDGFPILHTRDLPLLAAFYVERIGCVETYRFGEEYAGLEGPLTLGLAAVEQLERTLEGRPVVDRLAVRDDHALERELQQLAQRRPCAIEVRRVPDPQLTRDAVQAVGEHERPLLRQPERCLVAPAPVVERA